MKFPILGHVQTELRYLEDYTQTSKYRNHFCQWQQLRHAQVVISRKLLINSDGIICAYKEDRSTDLVKGF